MTSQNKILRFTMFGLLYFTQGTILGYFASLNAIYLLKNGLSIADEGNGAEDAHIGNAQAIF